MVHIREVFSSPPYAYSPRTLSLKHKFDWLTDKDKHKTQKRLHIFFKIDRGPVYHASYVVSNSPMAMSSIPYPDLSNLALLLKSWDATEAGWVRKWLTLRIDLTDVTLVTWVKISTEDFTDETLAINDTYEDDVREIVVLVMEVDKVANEVTDMEIDK